MALPGDKAQQGYRVLARKYRPDSFAGLVGQDAMVRTLRNAFAAGRIPQAWMLTGVRGVGKTTTARILARALNFRTGDVDAPTVDLDREGEHCRAIIEGRHVDVIEMDAASHTGIDDIKQIIDGVHYAPLSARYKVYIIDEVHMISEKAFNALLKTLEEPPLHAKFIFATTEIRKVPVTILSRCQRFDLRRVEGAILTNHLAAIAQKEGIEATPEAIAMIARAGDGSVRDALSIMDQAIAHGNGVIEAAALRDMLGLADRARTIDLFEAVAGGRASEALAEFKAQYDGGADPVVVLEDLAGFVHLLTRMRYVEGLETDTALSVDERERGKALSASLSVPMLARFWQMLLKGIEEAGQARRPFDAAEMVLIRLCHAADLPGPEAALKRLAEGGTSSVPRSRPQGGTATTGPQAALPAGGGAAGSGLRAMAGAMQGVSDRPLAAPRAEAEVRPSIMLASLEDIAALADKHRDVQFKIRFKQAVRLIAIAPGRLEIGLAEGTPPAFQQEIARRLEDWTGSRWFVSVGTGGGKTLAETEAEAKSAAEQAVLADPDVSAVMAVFPGAKIIRITDRDAAPAAPPLPDSAADDDTVITPDEFDDFDD